MTVLTTCFSSFNFIFLIYLCIIFLINNFFPFNDDFIIVLLKIVYNTYKQSKKYHLYDFVVVDNYDKELEPMKFYDVLYAAFATH